jgi:hypothetical protein
MAGYECADQLNAFGNRVDLLNVTEHLQRISKDYEDVARLRFHTVREGVRWSYVEKTPYQYDWSTVLYMIQNGKDRGMQQVWDICHFGFPDDLTPLHPMFARRFAALCREFVKFYRAVSPDDELIITPINEVSFLSWLGGDVRGTSPYCVGQGWEVKYRLMKAYIEGIVAMKGVDPTVRILTTEPIMNIVPPLYATDEEILQATVAHEIQYQALDILTGAMCPELGGQPEYLDILGFNYYYNNQCVVGTNTFLPWANEEEDPRFQPLSELLTEAYSRYRRPIAITETSHSGEDRGIWIKHIAGECSVLIENGLPLWGICIYPIIDRPDWDNLQYWHHSGLWDAEFSEDGSQKRVLNIGYADSLLEAQLIIKQAMDKPMPGFLLPENRYFSA